MTREATPELTRETRVMRELRPSLTIREMAIADLPAVQKCASEFYGASRFLGKFCIERFCEIWKWLLTGGDGVIFADERDGEIVGAIGGIVHRDIYSEAIVAEEFFWFVREAYRGSGIALYRRFEEWAVRHRAETIQMVHLRDVMPEKVERFYLRAGFHPIETRYAKELKREA
jgi:GNAT superfamily N-acetyltransferase